jgi:hypothetical protein
VHGAVRFDRDLVYRILRDDSQRVRSKPRVPCVPPSELHDASVMLQGQGRYVDGYDLRPTVRCWQCGKRVPLREGRRVLERKHLLLAPLQGG